MNEFWPEELDGGSWMTRKIIQYGYPLVQQYARSTAPDPAFPHMARLSGGAEELSKGGRPVGAKTGTNKDRDGGVGHLQALTSDETDYLTDLFFKKLKASGGIHYLYNHMRADGKTIPWRKVVAFHKSFTVNQKSRPAKKQTKSLAVVPKIENLVPMRRMGMDFIVMQAEQGLAADRDMADRNHTSILNIVDYTTRMSFPFAQTKNEDVGEAGRAVRKFVRQVRRMFYNDADSDKWPSRRPTPPEGVARKPDTIITVDGGNGFKNVFRDEMREELGANVLVEFVVTQANTPNQNSITEASNSNIRNILRRIAQANRADNEGTNKPWQSNWYGQQGHIFHQMQKLINMRTDQSLGKQQPIDVWAAYKNGNQVVITKAQNALIDDARKRRGPSTLKPEKYFKVGQIVRRIDDAYLKADVRSNKQKQSGRWSDETYRVYKVFTTTTAPPSYTLQLESGVAPANFKTRLNKAKDTVSVNHFPHDKLQLVIAQNETPIELMDGQPAQQQRLSRGDHVELAWIPIKQTQDNGAVTDELVPAFEKLDSFATTVSSAWDNARFFEGEIVRKNGINLDIDFPDDTDATINVTNANQNNFVGPDWWKKMDDT